MTDLEIYYENTQKPWGKLFYKIIWSQLSFAKSLKILDFGSGFGITANHLAAENEVTAIEPDLQMCEMGSRDKAYTLINGNIDYLTELQDRTFDLIICHNVFEYLDDKSNHMAAFSRLLKVGGRLSLVKHNHIGRIMQRVVHDNDIEAAMKILNGEPAFAQNFGEIKYYDSLLISKWISEYGFKEIDMFGVRTFFALNPNDDIKYNTDWNNAVLELELRVGKIDEFRNISFYNHIILEKI